MAEIKIMFYYLSEVDFFNMIKKCSKTYSISVTRVWATNFGEEKKHCLKWRIKKGLFSRRRTEWESIQPQGGFYQDYRRKGSEKLKNCKIANFY